MSTQTKKAEAEFAVAMKDPDNLVAIHKQLNRGSGRRWRETTLNRAIVVLTVAAWQAYVEDLARGIVATLKPPAGQPGSGLWPLVKAATDSVLSRFNTPNADNARNVLLNVGFDPRPYWKWSTSQGLVTPDLSADRMNEWLRVRHRIAHGDDLPAVGVISKTAGGTPTLTRENAEACMSFFRRLVAATSAAANAQFP